MAEPRLALIVDTLDDEGNPTGETTMTPLPDMRDFPTEIVGSFPLLFDGKIVADASEQELSYRAMFYLHWSQALAETAQRLLGCAFAAAIGRTFGTVDDPAVSDPPDARTDDPTVVPFAPAARKPDDKPDPPPAS